jgi:hypothetical protein
MDLMLFHRLQPTARLAAGRSQCELERVALDVSQGEKLVSCCGPRNVVARDQVNGGASGLRALEGFLSRGNCGFHWG